MTDFVIIGAGVYGAATAWWLARQGASVHILEQRDVAARASGGPGRRGVRANGRDLRELPLMVRAYEQWPSLHQELGAPEFYERTGHLLLAESDADCERLPGLVWAQQRQGIDTRLVEGAQLRELEPGLSPRIRAAAYCPLDGVAAQAAVTRAYANAAAGLGATITTGTRIESIEVRSGRATAVITAHGERIAAGRGILLLGNSEVRSMIAPWASLPVWNITLQIVVSEAMQVPFRHLTGHLSRTVSLKTEAGSRVMVSGGWRGRWDDTSQEGTTLPEAVQGNIAEAARVYPALEGLRVESSDAGHQESFCIDDIPIIDTARGVENLWYATGWCGHGWAIAPVVTQLMAQWALESHPPALLAPFSHRRFAPA